MTTGVHLSTIPARSIPTYNELSYDDYLVCPRSQRFISFNLTYRLVVVTDGL